MDVNRGALKSLALIFGVLLVLPMSASAAGIVLQGVNVDEYPTVNINVALTADLVPDGGAPEFTVLENGIETHDVRAETLVEERAPIDVVLVLDESGSMQGAPLQAARDAAKGFVASMRPEDRVAVVAFSSEPRVLSGFSGDVAALTRAIDTLEASGETALYDGLIRATKIFEDNGRDRYITVLSDGGDTTSINTIDAASDAVNSAGAPVYAVALESPEYDPTVLGTLATSSGGRQIAAQDSGSLAGIFEDIAQELRNTYSVSFVSARPATKDLEIELNVRNGDVTGSLVKAVPNPIYLDNPLPPKGIAQELAPRSFASLFIGAMVLVAVAAAAWTLGLMLAPEASAIDQLRYYEQFHGDDEAPVADAMPTSRGRVMDAVAFVSERRGFTGEVSASLERAGLPLRANEYIFFHVLGTTIVGALVRLLTGSLLATTLAVAIAVVVPIIWLRFRVDRRKKAFEEQLPDVLSLIAGSLRAGWGIQQAIGLVVQEVGDPSAAEFRRVESETRFGLAFEEALRRMANRLESDDFSWTVTAVSIQREVGGNLAEVLDIVATTIRQRGELKRHVSALTAESRFSAIALAILPFFIFGALAITSRDYLGVALESPLGLAAYGMGALLLLIGVIWIARLTKVEI